jgi:2-methylcitrate dehydratase PrpD
MDGNRLIGEFVANVRFEALPAEAQHAGKLCFMDSLAATISGALVRISEITAGYAAQAWPGDEATIMLGGRRSTAAGAAFANACSGNGLDIDDVGRYTRGHPGAQLIPVALAVGEKVGAAGKDILAAVVMGYEVAMRAGRCWHHHHENFFQSCGSWGSLANAAVAARLLGLDCERTVQALGIAEYYAPNAPMMRDIDHPAMVKHGIGWGAMTGVTSAELAQRGFTGIPSLLGFPEYEQWVSDIGQRYLIVNGVYFKRYAACGWGHPAHFAAHKLVRENGIAVGDIARIRVEGYHETTRLWIKHPATEEEAQFSVAWPMAALLIDGAIGPDQMLPRRYDDPDVLALADKIELVESLEINNLYRSLVEGRDDPQAANAAAVEIVLKDGRRFYSGLTRIEEGPYAPFSDQEMEAKFRRFVGYVLERPRVNELVDMLWRLDELPDIRTLADLIATRG